MKRQYFEMAGKKYTRKQMQLISKLRDGWGHKQIADMFDRKKGTVDHNVSAVIHKAGVPNAIALVALAVKEGLQSNGRYCGKNLFVKVRTKTKKPAASPNKK